MSQSNNAKVRMLVCIKYHGVYFRPGEVHEVPQETAIEWQRQKWCEPGGAAAVPVAPAAPETAAQKTNVTKEEPTK